MNGKHDFLSRVRDYGKYPERHGACSRFFERRTKFMSSNLGRTGSCALALFLAFLLEPTRCGLPPVTGQAAEIRPAIIITEGNTRGGFPYMFRWRQQQ
jgi:hypothetical protein